MKGGSHMDAQSNEIGSGLACNHALPSDCLPHMVVRHLNPSSRAFTLCCLHGSRIALFSAALGTDFRSEGTRHCHGRQRRMFHYRVVCSYGREGDAVVF